MNLLNTPDATDDEEELLEEELVILDDDQVEQLIENLNTSSGTQEEVEMECDTEERADVQECEAGGQDEKWPVKVDDDAAMVLRAHSDAVFSVCVDAKCTYAASGGQDDVAYIWDLQTGRCLLKCEGHEESVTSVAFNCDGSLLATGDLSGIIQVWQHTPEDTETRWKHLWKRHEFSELQWLSWHPKVNRCLIAGSGENPGNIFLWSVSPTNDKYKCLIGIGSGSVDAAVLSDGLTLASIYESGVLRVWNIPQATATNTISLEVRNARNQKEGDEVDRTPICMAVRRSQGSQSHDTVAVGNAAGEIVLIHASQWQIITTLSCGRQESIESIAFSKTYPYASFCTVGGLIGVIDMTTLKMRHVREKEHGFSRLSWRETAPHFISASLNGVLTLWDARSGTELKHWYGHQDSILDMIVYADGSRILSCGDTDDRCVRIFVND